MSAPFLRQPTPVFPIGTFVYLKINPESPGMVTGYEVRYPNVISFYWVTWADGDEKGHQVCELTDQKTYEGVPSDTKVES